MLANDLIGKLYTGNAGLLVPGRQPYGPVKPAEFISSDAGVWCFDRANRVSSNAAGPFPESALTVNGNYGKCMQMTAAGSLPNGTSDFWFSQYDEYTIYLLVEMEQHAGATDIFNVGGTTNGLYIGRAGANEDLYLRHYSSVNPDQNVSSSTFHADFFVTGNLLSIGMHFDGTTSTFLARNLTKDLSFESSGSAGVIGAPSVGASIGDTGTTVNYYAFVVDKKAWALDRLRALVYSDHYEFLKSSGPQWMPAAAAAGLVTGTAATSLSAFTATGAGNTPYQATGAANLASFTSSGTGNLLYSGSAAADLSSFTAVGTGNIVNTVAGTAGLTAFTGSGLASLVAKATGVANLSSFTAIGTGAIEAFTSTGSATLSAFTASGSGEVPYSGTGSASLSAFTADSAGQITYKSIGVADLSSFTAVGTGNIPTSVSGSGVADIGVFASSGTGNLLNKATGSATLAAFVAAGNDSTAIVGSSSGILTAFTSSSTAKAVVRSIPTWAQLRGFVANANGLLSQDVTGSSIATLGKFIASADGTVYDDVILGRSYIKVPGQGTVKILNLETTVSVRR